MAMKMVIIAIMPYSAGVSRRASTRPTRNVIPELAMLSTKLQPTPLTVLFFKDSGTGVFCFRISGMKDEGA